jgi:hypothetical protein
MELKFNEEKHEYTCGDKKLTSVTTLISQYSHGFDSDRVIDTMLAGSEIYLGKKKEYLGLNKHQIKKLWEINSSGKSTYGTYIHDNAEKYALGQEYDKSRPEIKQVIKFFNNEGYEVVQPEMRVFSEKLGLAGTVDLLLIKDGLYYIADYKTCIGKDLSDREGNNWTDMMKYPINNVPCIEYWKYALQMSVYRYIIENEEDYWTEEYNPPECDTYNLISEPLKFGGQFIIHLIRSKDDLKVNGKHVIYPEMNRITYKLIDTPYMKDEVQLIVDDNLSEVDGNDKN